MNPDTQVPPTNTNQPAAQAAPARKRTALWIILAAVVVIILAVVIGVLLHHTSGNAPKKSVVYDKTGKPGAASSVGQPIKVGDYAYVNACNALPLSTISKQLGAPGNDAVGGATFADATTAPAYISDDGIESDCSYDNLGNGQQNYSLKLIETLSPDMAAAVQHPDKGIIAKMEAVPGLANAHYGRTYEGGDGVFAQVDNIYFKLTVADLRNATSGGITTDPQFKAKIISLAKQLATNIQTRKVGDSRAASTATKTTIGSGVAVVNNPCDIFTADIFATGIKHDTYIPAGNRIASPNDIKSTYGLNLAPSGADTDRYKTTCERTTADTTNYGQERAGSTNLSQALQDFTQPQNTAKATMQVTINSYASAAAAAQDFGGIVYLQQDGAQPISGYGDQAVYIPAADVSNDQHTSQLSVRKGAYIVDFTYAADQSLDFGNNKTATAADYTPFLTPVLAKLP